MDERSLRIERKFFVPMVIAVALVIPVLILEDSNVQEPWDTVASVLNWAIWLTFAVELVVMLAVVPDRKAYLRERPVTVLAVVLTPPFLPASLQAMRVVRLLQLVRLLVLVRLLRRIYSIEGLRYAALIAAVTLFAGATAFAAVEDTSAGDGLWWAVSTMTTVGYGDVVPVTDAGRIIGVFVMVIGIGFVTVLVGAAAERFLASAATQKVEDVEDVERALLDEVRELSARIGRIEERIARRVEGR